MIRFLSFDDFVYCPKMDPSLSLLPADLRSVDQTITHVKPEISSDTITSLNCSKILEPAGIVVKKESDDEEYSDYIHESMHETCKKKLEHKINQFSKRDNSLRQLKTLETQQRKYSKETPYQCEECGKNFTQTSDLKTHLRTHTGEKPYQCEQCGKCFAQASHLKTHQKIHTGEKPYQCVQCGKSFTEAVQLRRHKNIHTGEKPYQCVQCGKGYTVKSDLSRHQRTHTGEKPYQCVQCCKGFTEISSLRNHQRTHTGEKPYQCLQCGKRFTKKSGLTRHQIIHTGEKPYQCIKCGKSYTVKSSLVEHLKIHTGEKPFQCVQCGKSFTIKSSLVEHLKIHTGEKPYQCVQCGKSFTQQSNLRTHQKIHTGEKPYQCVQCGKSFTQQSNLRTHQKIHTGVKPYLCVQCGKSFTVKSKLRTHQKFHTGEKPYQCVQCGKSFKIKSSLVGHQKFHTGKKYYQCVQCGKSFTKKLSLKRHQRKHTGEKAFKSNERVELKNSDIITLLKCGEALELQVNDEKQDLDDVISLENEIKFSDERFQKRSEEKLHQCNECAHSLREVKIQEIRNHSGLKSFQCGQGGRTFSDLTTLGQFKCHQFEHTDEKLYKCIAVVELKKSDIITPMYCGQILLPTRKDEKQDVIACGPKMDPSLSLLPADLRNVKPEISPDTITSPNCGKILEPAGVDVKIELEDEAYSEYGNPFTNEGCKKETEDEMHQFNTCDNGEEKP
uniref:C2H2-type domain-containing protein n=2 Tax=Denticeps clupeoides TaxID=299321 RepID=A0AAY3ZVH5_9TELE